MSDVKRYKLAESVGYENEFGDCGLRIPAGQVVVRAADYDAETARADRAEARCAALFHALEMCVWRHAPYNEGLIDLQELRPYMNNLEAEALLKPHPGQHYLDEREKVKRFIKECTALDRQDTMVLGRLTCEAQDLLKELR